MTQPLPDAPAPNARFIARMPDLINTLLEVRDEIEAPVRRAETAVSEIQDYIVFEIQKLELQRDTEGLSTSAQQTLQNLRAFRDNFPASSLWDVTHTINELHTAMQPYLPDPLAGSYDPREAA